MRLFLGGPPSSFLFPFFFLRKREREREDKNTLFARNNNNNNSSARTIHDLSYGSRERECVCVCVCVHACVCKHAQKWTMIFLKREFRERLILSSSLKKSIRWGSSSLFFRPCPQGTRWRIFLASGEERNEFAFFSQKIVKKNKKKEAREEESSLLMCVSLFSFEEFRYTNNK